MKKFVPSQQQQEIFDAMRTGDGSFNIIARAGCGKTTTAIQGIDLMSGRIAFGAFNSKIAKQGSAAYDRLKLTRPARAGGPIVDFKTMHAYGLAALRREFRNVRVAERGYKVEDIMEQLAIPKKFRSIVGKLVSFAKQSAMFDPESSMEAWEAIIDHFDLEDEMPSRGRNPEEIDIAIQHAIQVLLENNLETKRVDFDDMLYLPLLFDLQFDPYDKIVIDESQDTNMVRRMIIAKMLRPGGRVFAIGDPKQAIYGFTGADEDSMDQLAATFNSKELPLTVTYRCGKQIVAHAQSIVPDIVAHESNHEGLVDWMPESDFSMITELGAGNVILCRYNAPLITMAYANMRRGIPCYVEGRDIGRGLLDLIKKFPKARSLATLSGELDDYRKQQTERLGNKPDKLDRILEKIESLEAVIDSLPAGSDVEDIEPAIRTLFKDTPDSDNADCLVLSTIHKSKGREWDNVYIYGDAESSRAKLPWQIEQERNLHYVAITRAKNALHHVMVD